jgi:hypothetical protein
MTVRFMGNGNHRIKPGRAAVIIGAAAVLSFLSVQQYRVQSTVQKHKHNTQQKKKEKNHHHDVINIDFKGALRRPLRTKTGSAAGNSSNSTITQNDNSSARTLAGQ